MDKQSIRIIYMGTPDFAVESLRALVEGGYQVVAVVTMPDKPAGRGHQLQFSAVKQYALSVGLPVLQPERLKDETFLEELRAYQADLQIVVAFRMLPEVVWNMPRLGTFNLHASLLPQYRGAAPINWAVMNGDTETGATTFMLQHEIDTGNIILQERLPIAADENVGSVHDRLMLMGADLVTRTVDAIIEAEANYDDSLVKEIPVYYTKKLKDSSKLITDFSGALQHLASVSINYSCMSEIEDVALLISDFLHEQGITARKGMGTVKADILKSSKNKLAK